MKGYSKESQKYKMKLKNIRQRFKSNMHLAQKVNSSIFVYTIFERIRGCHFPYRNIEQQTMQGSL